MCTARQDRKHSQHPVMFGCSVQLHRLNPFTRSPTQRTKHLCLVGPSAGVSRSVWRWAVTRNWVNRGRRLPRNRGPGEQVDNWAEEWGLANRGPIPWPFLPRSTSVPAPPHERGRPGAAAGRAGCGSARRSAPGPPTPGGRAAPSGPGAWPGPTPTPASWETV